MALATVALLVVPLALGTVDSLLGAAAADVAGVVFGDLVLLLVAVALLRRFGGAARPTLGAAPAGRDLGWSFGLAIATLGLSCGTTWCAAVGLHRVDPETAAMLLDGDALMGPLRSGPPALAALLLVDAVVVAPILEEWLFRGVLLSGWTRRFGVGRAVLLTSMLFGVLHPDPIGAAIFGWVAALLTLRSGSLWTAIVFHVVHNGVAVAAALGGADLPGVAELAAWGPTAALAAVLGAAVVATWVRTGAPASAPLPV